jgi:hypothetical protein
VPLADLNEDAVGTPMPSRGVHPNINAQDTVTSARPKTSPPGLRVRHSVTLPSIAQGQEIAMFLNCASARPVKILRSPDAINGKGILMDAWGAAFTDTIASVPAGCGRTSDHQRKLLSRFSASHTKDQHRTIPSGSTRAGRRRQHCGF